MTANKRQNQRGVTDLIEFKMLVATGVITLKKRQAVVIDITKYRVKQDASR